MPVSAFLSIPLTDESVHAVFSKPTFYMVRTGLVVLTHLYDMQVKIIFFCSPLFIVVHGVTLRCVVSGVVSPANELRFLWLLVRIN